MIFLHNILLNRKSDAGYGTATVHVAENKASQHFHYYFYIFNYGTYGKVDSEARETSAKGPPSHSTMFTLGT